MLTYSAPKIPNEKPTIISTNKGKLDDASSGEVNKLIQIVHASRNMLVKIIRPNLGEEGNFTLVDENEYDGDREEVKDDDIAIYVVGDDDIYPSSPSINNSSAIIIALPSPNKS